MYIYLFFFFQKKILTINLLDIISLEQPFGHVEQFLLKAFTVFRLIALLVFYTAGRINEEKSTNLRMAEKGSRLQ